MFEITFRTEDKATWHKLLEILDSLDMPHLRKQVASANDAKKENQADETGSISFPLQEKGQGNSALKGIKKGTPVSVFKNWTGDIEIPEGFIELLEKYNPEADNTSVGATGKPVPAVPIAEWAGWAKGPIPLPEGFNEPLENYKPGFGCAKGMFVMSPGFDEPLEDFKEYM